MKKAKQLERYFKGAANHRRIDILALVNKHENVSVEELAELLHANLKTISSHTHSLVRAGLLNKTYKGRRVEHKLSPYGDAFLTFMRTF